MRSLRAGRRPSALTPSSVHEAPSRYAGALPGATMCAPLAPAQSPEVPTVKRSTDRILTTHVGSLVKPDDLQALIDARELGQPFDSDALDARIRSAVRDVVH